MGLTLLAQECKIGTTTYYLANVKANTLIQNVGYASEMENWPDMFIVRYNYRKLQMRIGECCISKLEKVAKHSLKTLRNGVAPEW